jgi:glucosamine--fructose-6-phosphate aminotransferase (isomerizing)
MSVPTTDSAMYQTMHRQPSDLRRLLAEGWEPARQAADLVTSAGRVFVVGIGTSYHAAQIGAWLLSAAGLDARPVLSFDFALYPEAYPLRAGDAVIVMAHSGVKRYSSESMARASAAGATVLSVGSLTAEHPGSQLVLRTVEREKSAAFTASHLAAMTVLAQVAAEVGERTGADAVRGVRGALEGLPGQVEAVLAREEEVQPIAREAVSRHVYAMGAGPNAMTATEAVIKAREAAYGTIDALPIEQFLHGPMVTVNAGDLAVVVNVPGPSSERVAEIVAALDAMDAMLWLVGEPVAAAPRATLFALPPVEELISPLLAVVPMQILAYQMAALKGINPDTFRRDNPVYARAFGLLKL